MKRGLLILPFLFILAAGYNQPAVYWDNIDIWEAPSTGQRFRQVTEDPYGYLWFSTTHGIFRYDGDHLVEYDHNINDPKVAALSYDAITVGKDSSIWIGSIVGTVENYDFTSDRFKLVIDKRSGTGRIYRIVQFTSDELWLCAEEGLFRFNLNSNKLEKFVPDLQPVNSRGFHIRDIIRDEHNPDIMWVGGMSYFLKFYLPEQEFEKLNLPYRHPISGNILTTNHLLQLTDGRILAGTWHGGILEYNPQADVFGQAKVFNGSMDIIDSARLNLIFSLKQFSDSICLIACGSSIGTYNFRQRTFEMWPVGLPENGALQASEYYMDVLQASNGDIVCTRQSGFSIGDINNINNSVDFKPQLHGYSIDGRVHVLPPLSDNVVKLDPEQRDVSFAVSVPGHRSDDLSLEYKLEGFDKDWLKLEKGTRTIRYTNLPQGRKYELNYRLAGRGGDWVDGIPLIIVRDAHFWQRPSNIAGIILAIMAIVGVFIYLRMNAIREKANMQKEFEIRSAELELKALRSQMNPHFMFNTLNSIKHYILTSEPLKASEYLTKFATLVRSVLRNSTEKFIPLSRELETLLLYVNLEQLRFHDKFDVQCKIESDVPMDEVMIPPLVLQPYVENAIWHGLMHKKSKGRLSINIARNGECVICSIDDNGIGREQARVLKSKSATTYKSMGMGLTKNRIEIINRLSDLGISIEIVDKVSEDGIAEGTTVVLRIPNNHN